MATATARAYRPPLEGKGESVALAALIAAYHESGEPGHLRATLPLAGRTVIERQARLAAAAGAAPVIVVVERMPAMPS